MDARGRTGKASVKVGQSDLDFVLTPSLRRRQVKQPLDRPAMPTMKLAIDAHDL